ncbi:homeobox protein knotted-1-like 3 isoform X2 [Impatiens glandulifera]|uniref:homeobox protein knotted-1-like 3 isoform X2 n=1 Tax=Impatiens glandulifera TaxID=253017 RepID=UPI001FB0D29C|nr:homeobox protein knotted-1-like 3 isoform X2 [Impatiens glandulifera]
MAFPNHLSQEMALQNFSGHHLPEHIGQSSPEDAGGKEHKDIQRLILESTGKSSSEQHQHQHQHHHQHQQQPTWLNSAILRQSQYGESNFLHLHTNPESTTPQTSNQWLSRSILQRNVSDVRDDVQVSGDSMIAAAMSHDSTDLNPSNNDNRNIGSQLENNGGGGGDLTESDVGGGGGSDGVMNWQNARNKAEILSHPLYEQLLSAHVACLRIATPVDQLPRIDAQLAQSQNVVAKYSGLAHAANLGVDEKELDQFMTHYVLLLCSFKEQLQQHVRVHAMEAVMACWEIEQSLQSLTGVSPGEGTGATMSDDEDDPLDSDAIIFDGGMDGSDSLGFGPLIPTETERTLMERVRQELKHELKQGYKEKIVDIREEILRKRRAGKLPGDTTSVLKSWWQSHAKWPYPTEEDKARLVQETGLQLKQINNWFINQRKRNWHSNPSSSTVLKSKRKR